MSERSSRLKGLLLIPMVALLSFGTLCAEWTHAQPSRIVVNGVVTGTGGVSKGLARIELNGQGQFVVMSDSAGRFIIRDVMPGRYQVTVRQGGNFQTLLVDVGASPLELKVNW